MYSLYNISFRPLYESIFIGLYSLVLFSVLKMIVNTPYAILLFVLGVSKHLIGYFGGLQTYYCKVYNNNENEVASIPTALDIILEGFLYVIIGLGFLYVMKNKYMIAFLTGVVLHLGFEMIGLHTYFLKNRCIVGL